MNEFTDEFQEGRPPYGIRVEAWIRSRQVRKGVSNGGWFWFSDCTHPAQNAVADLDDVWQWRVAAQDLK